MGAEDFAFEAVMDELGDTADMVDMGMGEEKKINVFGRNRPGLHGGHSIMPLGHTAIHKNVETITLEKMTGTGDGMLTAEMDEMHGRPPVPDKG